MTNFNIKNFSKELLIIVLSALVIFLVIQTFLVGRAIVVGSSMEPNLHTDQRILVNKVAYAFAEPERGDVIVFTPPFTSDSDLIKRVIGLPGETVEIVEGVVYIHQTDGSIIRLEEDYIKGPLTDSYTSGKIPADSYFVMGDNRNNSRDSREGWFVKRSSIHGRAWFSIWPLSDWGAIISYDYATAY